MRRRKHRLERGGEGAKDGWGWESQGRLGGAMEGWMEGGKEKGGGARAWPPWGKINSFFDKKMQNKK